MMLLKQQVNMGSSVQEQLKAQLFEMRDRIGDAEHREFLSQSSKDLM